MKILLLVLLMTACKSTTEIGPDDRKQHFSPDEEFRQYITMFEALSNKNTLDSPINFKDLSAPVIGQCWIYWSGEREIFIDPYYWSKADYYARKALIFHELGHCVLDRGHDNSSYKGYDLSLMNSTVIFSGDYQRYEVQYDNELITGDNTPLMEAIDNETKQSSREDYRSDDFSTRNTRWEW